MTKEICNIKSLSYKPIEEFYQQENPRKDMENWKTLEYIFMKMKSHHIYEILSEAGISQEEATDFIARINEKRKDKNEGPLV